MSIRFASQDIDFELQKAENVKKWISRVIRLRGKRVGNISYLFCDDEHLLGVNQQYLNHDTYTDIITFDYVEDKYVSGDMFISYDRVCDNAENFNVSRETELLRVMIHGVLHLVGYDDLTDEQETEIHKMEDFYIDVYNKKFRK
mgnify:CR=1 FL=1